MRSAHELRVRIQSIYDLGEHLDHVDYCGRMWLASYAADADIVADCLLELLDGKATIPLADPEAPECPVCSLTR